ncbi:unnamed protein product [Ectocarpus sp. 6 AP-2014]
MLFLTSSRKLGIPATNMQVTFCGIHRAHLSVPMAELNTKVFFLFRTLILAATSGFASGGGAYCIPSVKLLTDAYCSLLCSRHRVSQRLFCSTCRFACALSESTQQHPF